MAQILLHNIIGLSAAATEQQHARERLCIKTPRSLDALLSLINRANLDSAHHLGVEYRSRTPDTGSQQNLLYPPAVKYTHSTVIPFTINDSSSNKLKHSGGDIQLNIQYCELDLQQVRSVVCSELFQKSEQNLQLFLTETTAILSNLRKYFWYLSNVQYDYTKTEHFQSCMIMFTTKVSQLLGYSTSIHCPSHNSEGCTTTHEEGTHIIVTNTTTSTTSSSSNTPSYNQSEFLLKLKLPFSELYDSTTDAHHKEQLVEQQIAFSHHHQNHHLTEVGGLTDLFAITVTFSLKEHKQRYYVCQAVTEVEQYILHFCLLYIANKASVKAMLVQEAGICTVTETTGTVRTGQQQQRSVMQSVNTHSNNTCKPNETQHSAGKIQNHTTKQSVNTYSNITSKPYQTQHSAGKKQNHTTKQSVNTHSNNTSKPNQTQELNHTAIHSANTNIHSCTTKSPKTAASNGSGRIVIDWDLWEEQEENERQEEILRRWHAKHNGEVYLCEEKLEGLGTRNMMDEWILTL